MTRTAQSRRQQRARAARQALTLCETEVLRSARGVTFAPASSELMNHAHPRVSTVTTRAALRAAGLPPHVAAALRSRLGLSPGQEVSL